MALDPGQYGDDGVDFNNLIPQRKWQGPADKYRIRALANPRLDPSIFGTTSQSAQNRSKAYAQYAGITLPTVQQGQFKIKKGDRFYLQNPLLKGQALMPVKQGKDWTAQRLNMQQLQKYVPQVVRQLVLSNNQLGFGSFGPISKTSFPLYAGRFYDDTTLRTRVMAKPSQKLLNPYNWQSSMSFLQARVIYKWNQFVNAVQRYSKVAVQPKQVYQAHKLKNYQSKKKHFQKLQRRSLWTKLNQIPKAKIADNLSVLWKGNPLGELYEKQFKQFTNQDYNTLLGSMRDYWLKERPQTKKQAMSVFNTNYFGMTANYNDWNTQQVRKSSIPYNLIKRTLTQRGQKMIANVTDTVHKDRLMRNTKSIKSRLDSNRMELQLGQYKIFDKVLQNFSDKHPQLSPTQMSQYMGSLLSGQKKAEDVAELRKKGGAKKKFIAKAAPPAKRVSQRIRNYNTKKKGLQEITQQQQEQYKQQSKRMQQQQYKQQMTNYQDLLSMTIQVGGVPTTLRKILLQNPLNQNNTAFLTRQTGLEQSNLATLQQHAFQSQKRQGTKGF